jgi:hypothetical protein
MRETIAEVEDAEQRLAETLERTSLPPEPDRAAVDRFLVRAHGAPGTGSRDATPLAVRVAALPHETWACRQNR